MANVKITDLVATTAPTVSDVLMIDQSPFGAGTSKKVVLGDIYKRIYPAADSTTAIQIMKADGTTPIINVDTTNGTLKLPQIGANASSYATQRSSGILNFESSQWTGSAEAKGNWTLQGIPLTTSNRIQLFLKYGSTELMRWDSNSTVLTSVQTTTQMSSTSTTTPALMHYLRNSSATANNYSAYGNQNQGSMITGYLAFKNISHHASTGSANLEFWLANGGAATNKMTLTAAGSLGIGLTPTANMVGLSVEAGVITLKETTTPTADADYGKIYTKSDNKLYFQDGAGSEHEIAYVA